MDYQKITYDTCRCYLHDKQRLLPAPTYQTLLGWIRGRQYERLASCSSELGPDVTGPSAFKVLRQVDAFFKKNAAFADGQCTRLAALISFEEGELLCEATNSRLDSYFDPGFDPKMKKYIEKMSAYIYDTLGPYRDFLENLPKLVKVTSGATATRSRRKSTPFLRVSKKIVCTPGAFPYVNALSEYFGYGSQTGMLVSENRIAFVPKSWKTDRTIACEAEGNVSLQLAFDKFAKNRLRRRGIDLRDQTRNQELAREGSINGKLSTIDLSMASDTLAYNAVALLFPEDWFGYLRAIRSQYYTLYPSSRQAYHKFSSMGNGATFALETLVFAAAGFAVGSSTNSVYGDDIIVDTDKYDELIALLAFLGFVPNTEKSFSSGPFRESCGKDWYEGIDVTPQYLRSIDRRKAVKCHFVNSMLMIAEPYGALVDYLSSFVKEEKLPFVPYMESTISGVWIDPHSAYAHGLIKTERSGNHSWIPRTKAYVAKSRSLRDWGMRSLFLWYLGTIGRNRNLPVREADRKSVV